MPAFCAGQLVGESNRLGCDFRDEKYKVPFVFTANCVKTGVDARFVGC